MLAKTKNVGESLGTSNNYMSVYQYLGIYYQCTGKEIQPVEKAKSRDSKYKSKTASEQLLRENIHKEYPNNFGRLEEPCEKIFLCIFFVS